jgi:mannosyltransferase
MEDMLSRISNFIRRPMVQATLLVLITLLAAALRFFKLGQWSFWGDEIHTVRHSLRSVNELQLNGLSFFLTGFTLNLLGTSEWSARLASAVIGIVSIPVFYFPVRKMLGPVVALGACLLLALSPWHLYWSQNARFYTALLLFYTLALFAFYFWLEENRPKYLVAFLVFAGLAVLERLFALFLAPVIGVYLLMLLILPVPKPVGLTKQNLALLIVPGTILALYLAWPHISDLPGLISKFAWVNNNPAWILAGIVFYIRIPIILLGTAGIVALFMQHSRAALLLGSAAIVPVLGITLLSLFTYTANRYAFVALSSWTILASVAGIYLFTSSKAKLVAASVLLLLMADPLSQNALYYQYNNGNRDDWKGAFALVERNLEENDIVAVSHMDLGRHYLAEKPLNLYSLDLEEMKSLNGRIWFVEDMNVPELAPEKHKWLERNAQLVAVLDNHVEARRFLMRVYLYDPNSYDYRLVRH